MRIRLLRRFDITGSLDGTGYWSLTPNDEYCVYAVEGCYVRILGDFGGLFLSPHRLFRVVTRTLPSDLGFDFDFTSAFFRDFYNDNGDKPAQQRAERRFADKLRAYATICPREERPLVERDIAHLTAPDSTKAVWRRARQRLY